MSSDTPLARARTLLFVPGNRPERFDKALTSGVERVVLDLEGRVPTTAKHAAREAIAAAWTSLRARGVPLVVRINPLDSVLGQEDVHWLARLTPGASVMVPKADTAPNLAALNARFPEASLLPLIESAAGYVNLEQISGANGVLRLVVGHIDFVADTGLQCSVDERELAPLRFAVAMHTRLHRLAPAGGGGTTPLDDGGPIPGPTQRARSVRFTSQLCLPPKK